MCLQKFGLFTGAILTIGITVMIIVGNTLVVLSVAMHPPLRQVQNSLLISLAVTDLAVGLFVVPPNIVTNMYTGRWIFGQTLCTVHVASDIFFSTASILHLCAIAVDRYLLLRYPTYYLSRRTITGFLFMITLVYLLSAVIVVPPIFGWAAPRYLVATNVTDGGSYCVMNSEIVYVIYSSVGSFYLPAIFILILHLKLFRLVRTRLKIKRKSALNAAARSRLNAEAGVSGFEGPVSRKPNELAHSQLVFDEHQSINKCFILPSKDHNWLLCPACGKSLYCSINQSSSYLYPNPPFGGLNAPNGCHRSTNFDVVHLIRYSSNKSIPVGSSSFNRYSVEKGRTDFPTMQKNAASSKQTSNLILQIKDSTSSTQSQWLHANLATQVHWHMIQRFPRSHSEICLPDHHSMCPITDSRFGAFGLSSRAEMTHTISDLFKCEFSERNNEENLCNESVTSKGNRAIGLSQTTSLGTAAKLREQISMNQERRAARTLSIIVGAFILCWLPFFVMYVLTAICREQCAPAWNVQQLITWLGYSNSAINPIVYTTFNHDFQTALHRLTRYRK
ncbi:unnamed protein product [Echinostoma caproni]|uniref:G_PROTEIN_RECEP_F1_2 domain-containing protein n=1 Tax=Echinostoma caproni TaxID=27848 RepID=A0A183A9R4_9TREM|nr:unnamed protein product [Echinostoma caproni]